MDHSIIWIVLFFGVVFGALIWQRRNPYVVTRTQMKDSMERVLANTMPAAEWEKLLRIPIKRDRYLNLLREKLAALPRNTSESGAANGALYHPLEMTKVAELLEALKKRGLGNTPGLTATE